MSRPPLGQSSSAGPGAFPSPSPGARCQQLKCNVPNCPWGPAWYTLNATYFLSLCLLPAPSSPPENPITFLLRAPWLFCSLDLGHCRRKEMTWNQHCQHFVLSLVQGRVVILPSPEPRAPHSYHTQASMLGWGMLLQVSGIHCRLRTPGTEVYRTEVGWAHRAASPGKRQPLHHDCQAPHWSSDPVLPPRVPALLLRCAGTCGRSHLVEGCFISVYKAMDSHSFAGLAQEGHCQRLDNFIGAPLPFEGVLKWGGILELFSKCYLDPWGLGGMISLLPSPTTPGPSGPPPPPGVL